jgi:hypothetical protein
MRAEEGDAARSRSARRHEDRDGRPAWPAPAQRKGPGPTRSNKTMHHPATRIGEIKHGKS